jgi:hypothetical protein
MAPRITMHHTCFAQDILERDLLLETQEVLETGHAKLFLGISRSHEPYFLTAILQN